MTDLRLYLWELIGSSPVFAGLAACISMAAGHFFTARSRLLGIVGSLYLGFIAWTTARHGFPFPLGVLTPENKRDLAIIAWCVGFIVGTGIYVIRSVSGTHLTLDDLPDGVPRDQLTATRAFNAARNTYDLYANAHAINDHLDLSEQDARSARDDPSLRRVEKCLRDIELWCRTARVPGLTAGLLDQLGALYLRQGRHEDARKCFDEAGELFDALPNTARSMIRAKSDFHYRCGVLEFREGNLEAALDRLQQSARETEASGGRADMALVKRAIERCRRPAGS